MKNIWRAWWIVFFVVTGSWLLADSLLPQPLTYFSFRAVFIQYTGVLGMVMMSLAMLLAVRPKWIESPLDGLDKMYRLHKWLGITGLIVTCLHWWWAQGTKWMVGWGWLERPQRRNRSGGDLTEIEQWFRSQRELAESLGEWAFYAAAILIILALIKAFPYHWFKKTHKWIAVAYLVLVFHSVILTKLEYWSQPVGWLLAVALLLGTGSAILVLLGQIGRSRKVTGTITTLAQYPGVKAIEGTIKLENGWPGHHPGQFAFLKSDKKEAAHPYTIASAWNPEKSSLRFIVKALGDWTGQLTSRLKVGMEVTVEGPYGCFDFNDEKPTQIWVAAGIGITPFVARMRYLAQQKSQQEIHLFHTTTDFDQSAMDKLAADARAARVHLHLTVRPKDPRLTPQHIRSVVTNWENASIWFCGPTAMGQSIRKDFAREGLAKGNYHQELFEMR